jgi:hypothetical protein
LAIVAIAVGQTVIAYIARLLARLGTAGIGAGLAHAVAAYLIAVAEIAVTTGSAIPHEFVARTAGAVAGALFRLVADTR